MKAQMIRQFAACPTVGLGAFITSFDVWSSLHDERDKKIRNGEPLTWLDNSHSNLIGSMGVLLLVDTCARVASPRAGGRILAATIGVGVLANIQSEVAFWDGRPDYFFPVPEVKTDLGDLGAGLLGTLAYAISAVTLEKALKTDLGKICK